MADLRHIVALQLLVLNILMLFCSFDASSARKRTKPPLIEDIPRRKMTRQSHCQFGNQSYAIEERWRPNLGPPFGVLFCVHCECIAVQRKHRKEMVARVRCKNIKNDCPKPSCDNPVLLPEGCCKTCPPEVSDSILSATAKTIGKPLLQETKSSSSSPTTTPIAAVPTSTMNSATVDNSYAKDENNVLTNGYSYKCQYEKEIFEDGTQWKSHFDDCQMCSCQRGRVKCEQMVCPLVSCANPVTPKGECCAVCEGDSLAANITSNSSDARRCYFEGEKKYHVPGSKWHPYVPPFGFDKCSLCTCMTDTLVIKCEKVVSCPPLPCPEYEAFRENPMDCCKRCPNAIAVKSTATSDQLGDQRATSGLLKSPQELLSAGGCTQKGRVHANGDEWHPTVQPFGEVKCVKCRCKDKRVKCNRIKCPKLTCAVKVSKEDKCCPRCAKSRH